MPLPNQEAFPFFPSEDRRAHEPALTAALQRVLERGRYILDEEVAAFEGEFAAFLGAPQVVGAGSGTDAIELILRALEIGAGARVVIPAMAPSAVASAVVRAGATPLLADIDATTFTLCPQSLDAVLRTAAGRQVRAVLAVHLYGHPADWDALSKVAEDHQVILLEDGAQAHGACWRGRQVGSLGRAAAFSFYPTKNLAALGDAGAVATADEALATRLRQVREYGWRERGDSVSPGVNSRLDEMQAAMLRVKLLTLPAQVQRRRQLAARYDARLRGCAAVSTPWVREEAEHAYHLYVVRCTQRAALMCRLQDAGVPVAVHYAVPLHQQAAWRVEGSFPEAERAAREVLSLPLHPYLSESAVDSVCHLIEEHHAYADS